MQSPVAAPAKPPLLRRTWVKVTGAAVAAVLLLGVGFGAGWAANGARPFPGAPAGWSQEDGMRGGPGQPGRGAPDDGPRGGGPGFGHDDDSGSGSGSDSDGDDDSGSDSDGDDDSGSDSDSDGS